MKQQLRQIYEDLSTGKITRDDALQRIQAVHQHERESGLGSLLFAPAWREAGLPRDAAAMAVTQHHVLPAGLPPLDAHLPRCRVAVLPSLREDDLGPWFVDAAVGVFERVQSIFRDKSQGRVLLQVVIAESDEQLLLAALAGMLKTAAIENPQLAGQVVLVPGDVPAEMLAHWLELELRGGFDAVVRYGRGVRQVLHRIETEPAEAPASVAFRDEGLYLITGGLGSLGTLFAREIVSRTASAHVILTGRREVSSGWFAGSPRITYRQLDLADHGQVEALVTTIRAEHGRLDGILHCAGMIADEFILRKSTEELRRVLEPKVIGTLHLDRATRDVALDFFVLFSSIAAAVGNAGQSDYATANAFLDRFAAYRNGLVAAGRRHGRTRSIQWPLWQAGGMRLDPLLLDRWQQSTGVRPMRTAIGLAAFHRGLTLPHDELLVVEGHLAQMRQAFLEPVRQPKTVDAPVVAAIDGQALVAQAEEFLRNEFSAILKLPVQKIDPRAALEQYGIDSILAMRLTGQLEKTFGTLSKTLFFEYQTVRELAGYLAESHTSRLSALFAGKPEVQSPTTTEAKPRTPVTAVRRGGRRREDVAAAAASVQPEPIAIIGLSGRYPQAVDVEAYWTNLREGRDCVTEVPRQRWDWREYFTEDRTRAGSHFSKWGGFIQGVDEFDPLFFNISPKEAKTIDPQERLFLQHAWMAMEDAGITRASLQIASDGDLPAQVGVYAGVMYNEYPLFGAESSLNGKRTGIPGSVASIANRVSYVLNLHGPSMTVDTMCSSSLTAIHLACQDLRLGRTQLALAGGVNVTIHPNKYLALSAGQFISGDGHCQSFGEGGDGYIPGEGVGVVVLKRLADAQRDGDPIYAVIRGSAINHGGRTNGFTVPNPQAQAAAIARALIESHTDPRHISYVEAHGTGTKLGDPIEIAALTKAFQRSTSDTAFCRIGSAKSNIGHCESAAGIAGLTKVLLQMQHQQLVPSLHAARLNPHIDFERTPFVVNQTLQPWEQPVVEGRTLPRIAGISSFGAGGSNAHLVVEEYRTAGRAFVQDEEHVIVLSARTSDQLLAKTRDLLGFVRARRQALDLASIAWTLQAGREGMDERLSFVASSIDALLAMLEAFAGGDVSSVNQGRRGKDVEDQQVESAIEGRDLARLAEAWVQGAEIDWRRLHGAAIPRRISLPAYPFAQERYWIDVAPRQASLPLLHPLLHANTSDIDEQRFTSTFTGREPFLAERGGRKVLPATACLEMVRAAVERALPERPAAMELRDVIWTQPVVIDDAPVSIALFSGGEEGVEFEIYSRQGDNEIVHCHGRALPRDAGSVAGERQEWVVPRELEEALHGLPRSIESVLIEGPCAGAAIVRARGADVDVCDGQGNVRMAIRGIRYATPAAPELAPKDARSSEARAIALPDAPAARPRRAPITLAAPAAARIESAAPARPRIRLDGAIVAERTAAMRLADRGDGVFTLDLTAATGVDRVQQAIERAQDEQSLHVLLLRGLEHVAAGDARELAAAVAAARLPLLAVAGGDLPADGFLLAALCDFMVGSEEARYGMPEASPEIAALLAERFGSACARAMHGSRVRTGRELRESGCTFPIVPAAQVEGEGNELAASLAAKPRQALELLKRHLAARTWRTESLEDLLSDPLRGSLAESAEEASLALRSSVVRAVLRRDGVAIVRMEDRSSKNLFTPSLMEGLEEAFARLEQDDACKVIVLTGYDHYFASGGTKESLLAIHAGTARFTDARAFRLPFDCALPVVAAMQGHGIGAGWSLGLFADFSVLSEESRYVSPYMDYGFTPGAGATWTLPARLGHDLARESLFTARPATGLALKQRGLRLPVVPRAQVEATALALAQQIARTPRPQLLALKQQWIASAREEVEATLLGELAMHDVTFVGQAGTLARIEKSFHDEAAPPPAPVPHERRTSHTLDSVAAALKTLLASELQLQESDIGEDVQFIDLGLDSISGVSWIRRINERFGTAVEATKVYSFPTLASLSLHVLGEAAVSEPQRVDIAAEPETSEPELPTPRRRRLSRTAASPTRETAHARTARVAIIGMAGQFPQAKDLHQYWGNLAEGRDCISEVSMQRWNVERFYQPGAAAQGKTNSRWVGALEEYDRFDPLFFNISPTEAEAMDPQQRLFLEASWHGIEHAGYDASALSGSKCGVFVGCAAGDYQELSRRHRLSAQGFTGNASSILAARISYFLNLQGPCVSIDTACSSSLVAIAQACDSLNAGDSDLALAGGVYVMAGPEMHIRTAQAGMLSAEGRCFTFDQRADGFVPGEGVGVIVLKRLADAERDGDTVYGVLEGWGINQDGRTNGITAPNPESQTRLMRDVHEKFGIDPSTISLVEAHGTGTKLGDPIEVEGLRAAFGQGGAQQSCALGSVKSNIGHCLTAAGIAGTLKLVLALQHAQLPPTIHFQKLNEHIDLGDSPFFVNTSLQPWAIRNAQPRRAAISSFGFSGTNAHLVIAEHVAPQRVAPASVHAPSIVPLSAKTAVQLQQKGRDLAAFLRGAARPSLGDLAYTLQVGREAMDERVAFVASSIEDLLQQLQEWLDGSGAASRGHARRDKELLARLAGDGIEAWIATGAWARLAEAWTKGLRLDWNRLHGQVRPRRVALPLYPFARDRYWIEATDEEAAPVLHPLLHANISDLQQTRFRSTFTGSEPFLREKALSAGALLEMARAAVEHALPQRPAATQLELRDVTWGPPLLIHGRTDVEVALADAGNDAVELEIYSTSAGRETVLCRGRAMISASGESAPALDASTGFVLPTTLLDAALCAAGDGLPYTLQSLRIHQPCSGEMRAWTRTDGSRTDITVGDANGKVCVELRGLTLRAATECAVVMAVPEWRAENNTVVAPAEIAERHVVLCELPGIGTLPQWRSTSLDGDPGASVAERYTRHTLACFEILQTLAQQESRALVQFVIREPRFAGLAALLKTAALEHARLSAQLILVPADITAAELQAWLREEPGVDPVVRFTKAGREVQRWREIADAPSLRSAYREDGVYLVTGGRGGLGTLFATEILGSTRAARIILTGRAADGALASHGGRVSYRTLDLSDAARVHELVADVVREHGRIDGILHCAGMTADALLSKKSVAEIAAVLAPKVAGTANLDEATSDLPLDFFVLFSSIASAAGNPGQADYAAANGFLDTFAAWRNEEVAGQRRSGRTRAIHWPLWQAGGMSLDRATLELVRQSVGAEPMRTATGLRAFHQSLALDSHEVLVVEGDRSRIRTYLQKARLFEPELRAVRNDGGVPIPELQQQLKGALAGVLGIDSAAIESDRPFAELGLDSFLGAELIVAINKKYGTALSHSRLFDYATIRELATFLDGELRQRNAGATPASPATPAAMSAETLPVLERTLGRSGQHPRARGAADDRIAIIGMSGRYPQAGDLQQFWINLATGRNAITEVPPSRWDVGQYYDADRAKKDKTYSKWIGAVDDHDRFDPLFFRISPQEAEYMDPQHRLFLQESYHAFEDAGYSTATLSNRKCGVYLGITTNEYLAMIARDGVLPAPVTSNSYAIAAARIAYYLNLKGPAISVDTACSSSLVAIHLAVQALRNGEIEMALAGGVTLWLAPGSYVAMSQAGMFSPDGQCKTFDDGANGIVNGEGVGAVVLKRLADAERDGDSIHGVLLGSAINQDGRTNGITAPSVNSQIELERALYEQLRIDPETITCVETHGTGTKLGDPIELEALATVFGEKTSRRNFCALGSVKSNIGHTTAAAGVAGLQKVLLSMRHRTLVPTLNVTRENTRFDFASSPFYVSREARPWTVPADTPRRAAVSSFGFSGTNAHLVVEEYGEEYGEYAMPAVAPTVSTPVLVPLSARTPEQLGQKVGDLLRYLRTAQGPLEMPSIAWTLQTGREAMDERLAVVASSVAELEEKLDAWLREEKTAEGVARGRVEPDDDAVNLIAHDDDMREAIERWIARRKLAPLADLWVRGLDLDWTLLHGPKPPRRISLPLYPFARERCWIDAADEPRPVDRAFPRIRAEDERATELIIDQILDQIANEVLDPMQGAARLRLLV